MVFKKNKTKKNPSWTPLTKEYIADLADYLLIYTLTLSMAFIYNRTKKYITSFFSSNKTVS